MLSIKRSVMATFTKGATNRSSVNRTLIFCNSSGMWSVTRSVQILFRRPRGGSGGVPGAAFTALQSNKNFLVNGQFLCLSSMARSSTSRSRRPKLNRCGVRCYEGTLMDQMSGQDESLKGSILKQRFAREDDQKKVPDTLFLILQ